MTSWRLLTLGELEFESAGVIQTGPFGSQLHASDYSTFGIPVVMPTNIRELRISEEGIARVSPEHVERLARHKLEPGDIVYSRRGDVEKCALVTEAQSGWLCGTGCLLVRVGGTSADPRFLSYSLSLPETRAWISGHAVGATMPNLNTALLREVPVSLPPLEEQLKIAATLGALDDKIESNRRSIRLIGNLLDTLSQVVESNTPMVPLRDLTSINRVTVDPRTLGDTQVDYYSLPAFDAGLSPDRVQAAEIKSQKLWVQSTSILLARLNPRINRTWWVSPEGDVPALASTEFSCLEAVSEKALAGLWLAIRAGGFRQELAHRVTGTSGSHQRVRPDDLLSIGVMDVRQLDDGLLSKALSLLTLQQALVRQLKAAASLRDALLPELVSGRLRISDAATVA